MSSLPRQALRAISVGTIAGLAGGVVAGVASRLAMRLSGALTVAANRGIPTEASFTVGQIELGDTIFLVFFSAYMGIFGGLAYVSVKPWIPSAGRARGLWFGSVLLLLFAPLVIESANPDFVLFGPPALNIVTFSSLFLVFGLVATPIADRLQDAEPGTLLRRTRIPATMAGALAVLVIFRILVVGALPGADAVAARSIADEMIRALFNGLRFHEIALSPTQMLTVGVILYVLVALPLVRMLLRRRPVAGTVAFGFAVVVGACLTVWEFLTILRAG